MTTTWCRQPINIKPRTNMIYIYCGILFKCSLKILLSILWQAHPGIKDLFLHNTRRAVWSIILAFALLQSQEYAILITGVDTGFVFQNWLQSLFNIKNIPLTYSSNHFSAENVLSSVSALSITVPFNGFTSQSPMKLVVYILFIRLEWHC